MEKEIRDRLIISRGSAGPALVRQYCRETVVDELWEMIDDGMADIAFSAAHDIGEIEIAKVAAKKILNSPGYEPGIRKAAADYESFLHYEKGIT